MLTILYVLLGLAMIMVVVTLVMGGSAMARQSQESRAASNKWMWRRVWAQVSAVGLLFLIYLVKKNSG